NRPALGLHAARGDVLVPPIESEGFAVAPEGPLLRHLRSDADDIEELLPLALRPGRFETDLLELLDEIPPRLLIARSRRSAALELVGGKFCDAIAQVVGRDLGSSEPHIVGDARIRGLGRRDRIAL